MNNNEQEQINHRQEGSQTAAPAATGGQATADELAVNNTSAKKAESNRRNCLKSTGPKTARGKKTVSKNALKHGFFSKWVLIQDPDGKESRAEYENFYARFNAHHQPVGYREEHLLDQIVAWSWRLAE